MFRIEAIEVSGTEVLDASEIRATAEEWLSGKRLAVLPKAHTLLYQPGALDESLRNRFLRIASLALTPNIRGRALEINVRERRPEGFWCPAEKDTCFLFDTEGMLFEEIGRPQGSGGLLVEDERGTALALGNRAIPAEWVIFMKSFAEEAAPDIWMRNYVIEAESLETGYIRGRTGGNWDVFLNVDPLAAETEAHTLKELLESEIGERAPRLEYIDLRVQGRAYYKLK